MARYYHGERIGREGRLMFGCSATLFDETGTKILLTRRTDNERWCLPSGAMDVGESASEACIREVWEETGLRVEVKRLLGVYSTPHRLLEYADGNRFQMVSLNFEVMLVGGTLGLSDETTAFGYFDKEEIAGLDIIEPHVERIEDAWTAEDSPFIR